MTTAAISGINPGVRNFIPSGSMSMYLEDGGIFNNCAVPFGCGYGYMNTDFYNNMAIASDNMTSLTFKQRSNQHVLGSFNEIIQKNLSEMAVALREGESAKAAMLYDEVYNAISKNYGEEITTQEKRVEYDQSIKATIANLYERVNGYPLVNDIRENGEGYFVNGFMQGLTLFNHTSNSAEELESYMLGTGIEGYKGKQVVKTIGKVVGGIGGAALAAGAGAGIGAAALAIAGTAVTATALAPFALAGLAIGGVIAIGGMLFNGGKPSKVHSAY